MWNLHRVIKWKVQKVLNILSNYKYLIIVIKKYMYVPCSQQFKCHKNHKYINEWKWKKCLAFCIVFMAATYRYCNISACCCCWSLKRIIRSGVLKYKQKQTKARKFLPLTCLCTFLCVYVCACEFECGECESICGRHVAATKWVLSLTPATWHVLHAY